MTLSLVILYNPTTLSLKERWQNTALCPCFMLLLYLLVVVSINTMINTRVIQHYVLTTLLMTYLTLAFDLMQFLADVANAVHHEVNFSKDVVSSCISSQYICSWVLQARIVPVDWGLGVVVLFLISHLQTPSWSDNSAPAVYLCKDAGRAMSLPIWSVGGHEEGLWPHLFTVLLSVKTQGLCYESLSPCITCTTL